MELSKKDRLILINQYLILDKLYPDNGYDKLMRILENGYKKEYYRLDDFVYPEMCEEDCKFVYDVLEMYRSIHFSNIDSKYEIQDTKFPGFDGNASDGYLQYATFLIDDDDRYQEQKRIGGYNSHYTINNQYRNMLAKWKPIYKERINLGRGLAFLSKEEIEDLLKTH